LFEPLFRLCIPNVTIFDLLGISRERVGNDFTDAAPRSLYQTSEGRWMGLSATSQSTFEGLAHAMDMPELLQDPRFKDNASRLENRDALNVILQAWLGQRAMSQVLEQLVPAGGVVGPVYDAAQIAADPHYRDREDILQVEDPELGPMKMIGVVPKFSETPGSVVHAGPTLGEHNQHIYGSWLGLSETEVAMLQDHGTV
jgi:crotonobetainyl-CoA:carnitine CoA-transferase CaiB-like acyl-CoA transferase